MRIRKRLLRGSAVRGALLSTLLLLALPAVVSAGTGKDMLDVNGTAGDNFWAVLSPDKLSYSAEFELSIRATGSSHLPSGPVSFAVSPADLPAGATVTVGTITIPAGWPSGTPNTTTLTITFPAASIPNDGGTFNFKVISTPEVGGAGAGVVHVDPKSPTDPTYVQAPVVDTTAPTVTAAFSGTAGSNGWYTSGTVTFTVDDPTAICDGPLTVTLADGAAQTVTVNCTDAAGNTGSATYGPVNIDGTAPVVTASVTGIAGSNGWWKSAVVSFEGTDATSGIASCDADVPLGDNANQSVTGSCTDVAGNAGSATASDIDVDGTAPVVTVGGVTNGAQYTVGGVPAATCSTTDATSGVGTPATATVTGGNANGVGTFTATCAGAVDVAGNPQGAGAQVTYTVAYAFCGFKQPLLVPVQTYKIGSTVPVKFCVADATGTKIGTATAEVYANGVLQGTARYDSTDGQYIFNLRTKGMAAGPLTIAVKLDDGTTHSIGVALR